jgi:hypothetical protein
MNRTWVAGGIAAVAVFAAVLWFARQTEDPAGASASGAETLEAPPVAAQPKSTPGAARAEPIRPAPTDPRLASRVGTPGNALVEYVAGPDGRLMLEIDNDPNSQGYRKPLREYAYAGERLAVITAYEYLGDQVQVIRATASYKPDGSVDRFDETTEYRKP